MTAQTVARASLHVVIAALFATVISSGAAEPSPTDDLVAAYSFEETSGAAVRDTSASRNDGAISGATRTDQGRFGRGLSFDGVDDHVTVPHASSLNLSRMTPLRVDPTRLQHRLAPGRLERDLQQQRLRSVRELEQRTSAWLRWRQVGER